MPSTPSTPNLLTSIPTFPETQASFAAKGNAEIRTCFAHPRGIRCRQLLEPQRHDLAMLLMAGDAALLGKDHVRSIITLLICEKCQCNWRYDYKNRMAEKWQIDFPDLTLTFTNDEWLQDRYTLSKRRTPAATPRRISSATDSSTGTPSLSQQSTRMEMPPDVFGESPTPATRRNHRTLSSSTISTPASPNLRRHVSNAQYLQVPEEMGVDPVQVSQALESIPTEEAAGQADEDEPMQDIPTVPAAPPTPSLFVPGVASKWAPSMIIDNVESILCSEIPSENRGALYAFQQKDGPHVKIGFTTQTGNARRSQIQSQSKIPLTDEWHWKDNIELRLLHRLERLVHADLAYAQRNLKTTDGHRNSRTQHEWFEIDMETAKACINFWHLVVHSQGREVQLKETAHRALFNCQNDASRHNINMNHALRLAFWGKRVDIPPQPHDLHSYVNWLTGCAAIALLPILFNVPERYAQACVVFGIGIWTRRHFQPSRSWIPDMKL